MPRYFCHACGTVSQSSVAREECPSVDCGSGAIEEIEVEQRTLPNALDGWLPPIAPLSPLNLPLVFTPPILTTTGHRQHVDFRDPFVSAFMRNDLLTTLARLGIQLGVHGSLGDVAMTDRDMDRIITALREQEQPTSTPVDPDVLQGLKRIMCNDDSPPEAMPGEATCGVCLENYEKGQVCVDLQCHHAFHEDCILPWFETHDTCPTCRKKVEKVED